MKLLMVIFFKSMLHILSELWWMMGATQMCVCTYGLGEAGGSCERGAESTRQEEKERKGY